MKVLISPISLEEAVAVADGGGDILDIKNVQEGSLGASFPWVIREIVSALAGRNVLFSASLGDLPFKPGTATLAALGALVSGARYIKAGLYDIRDREQGVALMTAVVRACRDFADDVLAVAAGYADYRRFGGIDLQTLVGIGRDSGADLVMVDTAIKDGKSLLDALSRTELEDFVGAAHDNGLQAALAGSIGFDHLPDLERLRPDLIGVRGCVCAGHDRTAPIQADLVRRFVTAVRRLSVTRVA